MNVVEMAGLLVSGAMVGVALAAPIGPINIEIVRRSLERGFWPGWMLGLGALTVDGAYALLAVTGFAQFAIHRGPRIALYLAGGLMLAWMGWVSLREARRPPHVESPPTTLRRGRSYLIGMAMAALNPMGIVYWLTVGAGLAANAVQRVGREGAPVMVAGVMLGILCWVTFLASVAHVSRAWVTGRKIGYVSGASGLVLIGFGAWFVVNAIRTIISG